MNDIGLYYWTATYDFPDGMSTDFKYCEYHTPSFWLCKIRGVSISTVGPCYTCSVQQFKNFVEIK